MKTSSDCADPPYEGDALPVPGTLYDDFCRPPGYSVYYAVKQDGALAFRIELPSDEVTPDRLAMLRGMALSIVFGDGVLRLVR